MKRMPLIFPTNQSGLLSQSDKILQLQPPQLLSRHSTACGGRPKPENLDDHDFYETHQKIRFLFLICGMLHIYTLHVRTQFIGGYQIHWCKISPRLYCSAKDFLFIDIKLQYYRAYCASSNSVTWREYTKSVSECDKSCLFVMPGIYIYLIVADSVRVGLNSSKYEDRNGSDKLGSIPRHKTASGPPPQLSPFSLQQSPGAGVTLIICSSHLPQERGKASFGCFQPNTNTVFCSWWY